MPDTRLTAANGSNQAKNSIVDKKIIWKDTADANISNGKLLSPNPGVAYVAETDSICFNNVVLPLV